MPVSQTSLSHGQRIRDLGAGQSIVLQKVPAGGSLEARRLKSDEVMLYWRYTHDSRTQRIPIGIYDSSAPPKSIGPTNKGYSIAAGLEAARELAKQDREVPGGLRAERARVEAQKSADAKSEAERHLRTVKALCDEYVAWLKKQEKTSWRDVENIFKNHLVEANADLAESPAARAGKQDFVAMLRRLTEAGKQTTARKLRSYLRAAYACAVRADSDAALPAAFAAFGVTGNPIEAMAPIKPRSDKNPLSSAYLRRYWRALQSEEGVIGAALRVHVLTGGQRTAQLTRLKRKEVDGDSLPLLDRKGKRSEPRLHLLPITKEIRKELQKLAPGEFMFSTDGGRTPMHSTSLSTWSQAVAERAGIPDFQLKRIRSGIETILAEAGVSLHIRGQLQSHGLGGVQERHYDAHHYLPEKRAALETLRRLLNVSAGATPRRRPRGLASK